MNVLLTEHARAKMNRREITRAQIDLALTVKPVWSDRDGGSFLSKKTLPGQRYPLLVAWVKQGDDALIKTIYWDGKPEPTTTPLFKGVVEIKKSRRVLQEARA